MVKKVIETRVLDTKALHIDSFEKLLEYFHELEPHPKQIIVTINVSWDDDEDEP
jgi:hypothetical protein